MYGGGRDFSEKYAEMIDSEIKSLIDTSYADAKKLRSEKKEYVEKLVEMLFRNEVVSKEEFDGIFQD